MDLTSLDNKVYNICGWEIAYYPFFNSRLGSNRIGTQNLPRIKERIFFMIKYNTNQLQNITKPDEIISLWKKAVLTLSNMTIEQLKIIREYIKTDIDWR
jgi:hypothetical protein